jgi:hypothetical protein
VKEFNIRTQAAVTIKPNPNSQGARTTTVRWKKNWPIDPENVEYGSVVHSGLVNLSRSHVLVRRTGDSESQYVSLSDFAQEVRAAIKKGRRLPIEHLRIAPIARRKLQILQQLTDWERVAEKAMLRAKKSSYRVRTLGQKKTNL